MSLVHMPSSYLQKTEGPMQFFMFGRRWGLKWPHSVHRVSSYPKGSLPQVYDAQLLDALQEEPSAQRQRAICEII